MKIIESEDVNYFDVDDTLICNPDVIEAGALVQILDPVTKGFITMRVHAAMVRLLREADQRGGFVIVWSRGGWEWAKNVILALNLEKYVDIVQTKPLVYFDDKAVTDWLSYRVYMKPGTKYKSTISHNTKQKE